MLRNLARIPGLLVVILVLVISGPRSMAAGTTPPYTSFTGARMFYTPLSIDFGPVGVDFASAQQVITITNSGSVTLTNFAGGGVAAPFGATQNCAGGVSPGASCTFNFTFTPSSTGIFSATSNVSTNAGPITVQMRGEGVGPAVHVSSTSLDFGTISVGGSSAQQSVTIRNTGKAILTGWAGGGVNLPFGASQNCAGGVLPGGSCIFTYSFSPSTLGNFSGVSSISTNAGNIQIAIKGTSLSRGSGALAWYTPLNIDFGPVGIGTTSPHRTVTITNNGNATLTNFAGGGVAAPFGASQSCAGGVLPGATCQYHFTFTPDTAGEATAVSTSSSNGGSIVVNLRGTGVGALASYSPLVIDFGPVMPGTTSLTQVVTITNNGMATLTNFAGGGVGVPFGASQSCAAGVAPGATCQFNFTFNPTSLGRFHATSSTSSNGGAIVVELWGGEALKQHLPALAR